MELCTKPHISMNRQCCPSAGGRQLVAHEVDFSDACAFVSFGLGQRSFTVSSMARCMVIEWWVSIKTFIELSADLSEAVLEFLDSNILPKCITGHKHSTSSEVLARGWSGIPPR